jgi:hypothetical protein
MPSRAKRISSEGLAMQQRSDKYLGARIFVDLIVISGEMRTW